MLSRRGFIGGLFAAPAIVAIDRLMPVKALAGIVAPERHVQWTRVGHFISVNGTLTLPEGARAMRIPLPKPDVSWEWTSEKPRVFSSVSFQYQVL